MQKYAKINADLIAYYRTSWLQECKSDLQDDVKEWAKPSNKFPAPRFSIVLPTKFSRNADHKLIALLLSLYDNAAFPADFEVLLGVDADDDMNYFRFVREFFREKLQLRIFVGEEHRGYRNLYKINAELALNLAGSSQGILSLSDDTFIDRRCWDVAILSMIASCPDRIYMAHPIPNIGAQKDRASLPGFLSDLWFFGPRSFHPFLSREFIFALDEATENMSDWTLFGNSVMSDSYFDILTFLLLDRHNLDMVVPMPPIGVLFEQSVTEHKEGGLWGDSPVIRDGLRKLYSAESIRFIISVSDSLACRTNIGMHGLEQLTDL